MAKQYIPRRNKTTARTGDLKTAIIASFMLPEVARESLRGFSEADWNSVLWWLDISGMALYFLDHVRHARVEGIIPAPLLAALEERLRRNRVRVAALRKEACVLSEWFNGGCVTYALLKGMSLTPDAAPNAVFRCQTDLDFLVARENVELAIHYANRFGYHLYAKSGDTLEFRAGTATVPNLLNLYSVDTQRTLELHLAYKSADNWPLIARRTSRTFDGTSVNTLSAADILVQQALHLLKHLCGEYTRLSWVLEFRRHLQVRSADVPLWSNVAAISGETANGDLAMAAAIWLSERIFGRLDFEMLPQWQTEALPPRIRLWLERYACDLLLSDSTASKLYGLLQNEIPRKMERPKKIYKLLFPHFLPARVMKPTPHETFRESVRRYVIEMDFFFRRLYFHLAEGVRFGIEVSRWRKAAVRCER